VVRRTDIQYRHGDRNGAYFAPLRRNKQVWNKAERTLAGERRWKVMGWPVFSNDSYVFLIRAHFGLETKTNRKGSGCKPHCICNSCTLVWDCLTRPGALSYRWIQVRRLWGASLFPVNCLPQGPRRRPPENRTSPTCSHHTFVYTILVWKYYV